MNLNSFAKEIHENACDKGFWDEPRPFDELCALMISELAEALEEARAGRPMEWYACKCSREGKEPCDEQKCLLEGHHWKSCGALDQKPEGIAVEMADCAIRILDYLGSMECDIERVISERIDGSECCNNVERLPKAFMMASLLITNAWNWSGINDAELQIHPLIGALACILDWFKANNLDFEAIARRKHEYNKTRSIRHGKLF